MNDLICNKLKGIVSLQDIILTDNPHYKKQSRKVYNFNEHYLPIIIIIIIIITIIVIIIIIIMIIIFIIIIIFITVITITVTKTITVQIIIRGIHEGLLSLKHVNQEQGNFAAKIKNLDKAKKKFEKWFFK